MDIRLREGIKSCEYGTDYLQEGKKYYSLDT